MPFSVLLTCLLDPLSLRALRSRPVLCSPGSLAGDCIHSHPYTGSAVQSENLHLTCATSQAAFSIGVWLWPSHISLFTFLWPHIMELGSGSLSTRLFIVDGSGWKGRMLIMECPAHSSSLSQYRLFRICGTKKLPTHPPTMSFSPPPPP